MLRRDRGTPCGGVLLMARAPIVLRRRSELETDNDVAISVGNRLEFYTNDTKTDTVRLDSHDIGALAYDEVHDILLYVDKQRNNDAICEVAISVGNRFDFYTNDTKTDTVRLDSHDLGALAYDEVHDILLYVDKQRNNDAICGYGISSKLNQCFTKRNGRNIHSIFFDPATELL
ncbi:hypothetical protein PYW07_010814 [Mythimna separata]|uniref:Uncharacterized protein n=1 Tax=Mythimna separata TaxID=271217 RepID=A0AAD8DL58_MYTSE|nr:hypothetical protein PYW07_010814 [Mythimna separata]